MHFVEQPRGRIGRAAEPIGDLPMGKMQVHRARMRRFAGANEFEQLSCLGLARAVQDGAGASGCVSPWWRRSR